MTCKANSCYNSKNYSWNDYCSYHEKCLSKLREQKYITNVQEIETFGTWFNNNCGYVINHDNSRYNIWIVVFEPKQWNKDISENWLIIMSDYWHSLSKAREEAQKTRDRLKYNDNPILSIHPKSDGYYNFSSIITNPYVENNQVGDSTKNIDVLFYISYSSSTPSNLDRHFKPSDIVWVKCVDKWIGKRFYHVGVYVGNDTVFHFSRENNAVEKTTWNGFLSGTTRKIVRFHSAIPFKNYKDTIKQAVWAKDNNFRRGNYNLCNRNCEHFANMLVYGVNFSQQIHERRGELMTKAVVQQAGISTYGATMGTASLVLAPFTFGLSLIPGALATGVTVAMTVDNAENHATFNNDKTSIHLENEIRNSNNLLGKKSDSETEQYERWYLQEVPSKENCLVM